jgi:hypothetical protein
MPFAIFDDGTEEFMRDIADDLTSRASWVRL